MSYYDSFPRKFISHLEVQGFSEKPRRRPLVFTNGCFDILHAGHVSSLEFSAVLGDLIVALNSDESVSKLKPGRPVNRIDERIRVVAALECVKHVTWFEDLTPERMIRALKPDILIKGAEYRGGEPIAGEEYVKSYGGQVYFSPMSKGLSTTNTIERVKSVAQKQL